MFGTRWKLIRLRGIPVYIDASWLLILALLTLTFARNFPVLLEANFPGVPHLAPATYWVLGLVTALAFFVCILLHEFGHALVGRAFGTPIRGITLFLFGGVAELGSEFLMAAAGPLVSLVLAVAFTALTAAGSMLAWPAAMLLVLGYLAFINATVLVFNLIPAFPLDGGRILRALLWGLTGNVRRATYWAALAGRLFAGLLIAFGVLQFFWGNWFGGVWTVLIGLFLNSAARGSYEQVVVREALAGAPVRRFMNAAPITVPPSLDLRHLVDDYVYRHQYRAFPVVSDGHLEGLVDTRALARVPPGEWDRHTVSEVMRHDLDALTVSPDADALDALTKFKRNATNRLLVAEGDRLVGIIALKDLLRFLDLRIELEGTAAERMKDEG
jgi:Zn-dependent protease/CBS domain-containing protein